MSTHIAPSPLERWGLRLSRLGLVAIVAVTFVTSFDAVSVVAADRGAVNPSLAWAIPLAIDGMIVVGSAIAWVEALRSGRWHAFPLVLVAAAGALSVAANVAHADGGDWLARTLAAVPPVALLASVELGAWQIRRDVNRAHGSEAQDALQPDVQGASGPLHALHVPHDVHAVHVQQGDVHGAAQAWLHANPGSTLEDATRADIASIAGVAPSTVSRKWSSLVDAVQPSTNGAHA